MSGLKNKFIKRSIPIVALLCLAAFYKLSGVSSKNSSSDFRIMFYNVENLYDTADDPNKNDDDFLPNGSMKWTEHRYQKKISDLAHVISILGDGNLPVIAGFCEVENKKVLDDLANNKDLKKGKYASVVTSSGDKRGSNVGLIYRTDLLNLLSTVKYTPSMYDNSKKSASRDILHIVVKTLKSDTLDIFICHYHSRVEGVKETMPYRINSAQLLREKTDSIFLARKSANVIIMGDFNDYPTDTSMKETLGAKVIGSNISPKQLYNMVYHRASDKTDGTYRYKGSWGFLDQIIVSGNLLQGNTDAMKVKENTAVVFSSDFMLNKDRSGKIQPFRTYSGTRYLGGISDHLPLYIDLE